jgi:hypothetical protein
MCGRMYWRQALDARQLRTEDWITDACENALGADDRLGAGDPQIISLMSPRTIVIGGQWWKFPISLLLTPTHVVAGRKKGLGRKADVHKWFRYDFVRFATSSDDRNYTVRVVHQDDGDITFHFSSPSEADMFADYCRTG